MHPITEKFLRSRGYIALWYLTGTTQDVKQLRVQLSTNKSPTVECQEKANCNKNILEDDDPPPTHEDHQPVKRVLHGNNLGFHKPLRRINPATGFELEIQLEPSTSNGKYTLGADQRKRS